MTERLEPPRQPTSAFPPSLLNLCEAYVAGGLATAAVFPPHLYEVEEPFSMYGFIHNGYFLDPSRTA